MRLTFRNKPRIKFEIFSKWQTFSGFFCNTQLQFADISKSLVVMVSNNLKLACNTFNKKIGNLILKKLDCFMLQYFVPQVTDDNILKCCSRAVSSIFKLIAKQGPCHSNLVFSFQKISEVALIRAKS